MGTHINKKCMRNPDKCYEVNQATNLYPLLKSLYVKYLSNLFLFIFTNFKEFVWKTIQIPYFTV